MTGQRFNWLEFLFAGILFYLPGAILFKANLVAVFPMWDVLFGTYYAPKWNEFPPTGVEEQPEIESFWEVQIFTFREWWRMFRAWRLRPS